MRHRHQRIPLRDTVAIVGDGQTESIYFADVRDTDRPKNLHIFPDFPGKIGSYRGVLDRDLELSKDYTYVYALIDMDTIIQDRQGGEYYRRKMEVQHAGVKVLENNPCFEMWFLLHFMRTGRLFSNCEQVSTELSKRGRIVNYIKSGKFLSKAKLYSNYKDQLKTYAMPNARALEDREGQDELYPRAQTYLFFEWYFNK
ncbi:RloB family protein [Algoriphagus resistens]|uniref:RloB family protein n=1 Tax=Algoriphagus resistens TaxID=1750590 RepID=UPI000716C0DA|nr:RloB family protein [Algoriphagus resistens]